MNQISRKLRATVIARAFGCCEYCRSQEGFATELFSMDHIIPQHLGGKTTLDNLALSCQGCNSHKHTKITAMDPESGMEVPLYNPRRQRWLDHFEWSADFTTIVGLTPLGRATVATLHMNREGVVNLRHALYVFGKHPPNEPQI